MGSVEWRRHAAELTLLVMESLGLFVLGDLLASFQTAHGPSIITIFAASLGGMGISRLVEHIDLPPRRLIAAGTLISLAAIWVLGLLQYGGNGSLLLVNRGWPQLVGVVLLGIAWLRASVNAQRPLSYPLVLSSFSTGLTIVVVGLLFGRGAVASRSIDEAALPYFVAGLLCLAFVHLGQSEHIRGGGWRGPWTAVVAGTTLGLALIGGIVGLLPLTAFYRVLGPIAGLLLLALDLIIYAIALPSVLLVNWLLGVLLGGHHPKAQASQTTATDVSKLIQKNAHHSAFAAVGLFLIKLLLIALALAAILGLIYWVYSRRAQREEDREEERESVWTDGSLRDELAGLLGGLRSRFRRAPPPPEPALPPRILAVRRLYLRLLERGAQRGAVRPQAATPNEFAPALAERFHSSVPETLSLSFSGARYGLVEPSDDQLQGLDRDLRHLDENR